MKVYFDLGDVCDIDGILGRVVPHRNADDHKIANLCYLFVAQYALASVKAIVISGVGENFVTFTPPNQHKIFAEMSGVWGDENIILLKLTFDSIDLEEEVRFAELQTVINTVLVRSGKSRVEMAMSAKVSLIMNEIGNALICLEC